MTTAPGTASGRVGRSYYDESEYFAGAAHLRDFDSPFQRYRTRMLLELHTPRPTDDVLDLGCGWGTISYAMAPKARSVVGLDFSQRAVEECDARLAQSGLGNLEFRIGDARDTGLPAGSFDVVVAADLFEHLYPDDSEAVAAEAFRVLRAGGLLAAWTPCRSHFLEALKNNDVLLKRDPSHVDYKSMDDMHRLLAGAGFAVERAYFAESHLPGLRLLERLGQRFVPLLRRRIAALGRKREEPATCSA